MEPEGESNAGIVILKFIVISCIWIMACTAAMAAIWSVLYGWPFALAFQKFFPFASIVLCVAVVMAILTSRWTRMVSASVSFSDRETFVSNANESLVKCQYQPAFSEESTLTFKAGFPLNQFYDAICIHVGESSARIVGPRYYVKRVLEAVRTVS